MKEKILCISCKKENDISKLNWIIGIYKDMKSKEFTCECGQFNRYSISVGERKPKILESLGL